jgi:hyperosmotically inducible protein
MRLLKCFGMVVTALLIVGCDNNSSNEPARGAASTTTEMSNSTVRANSSDVKTDIKTDVKNADNTGRNVRDRSDATLTPGDQGNSDADIQTTTRIRRALTSSDQLSTLAKNIKIITADGKVTLRGPVNNEQEKQAIEAAAKQTGATSIDNQLEIKTNNP